MKISLKLLIISLTGVFIIVSILYSGLLDNSAPLISQDLPVQNNSEKRSGVFIGDVSNNQARTDISDFKHDEPTLLSGQSKDENNQALSVPVVAILPAQATAIVANQFVSVASTSRQESNEVESKSGTSIQTDNMESSPTELSAIAMGEVYPEAFPGAAQLLRQLTQTAVQSTAVLVNGLETARKSHMQALQDNGTKNLYLDK